MMPKQMPFYPMERNDENDCITYTRTAARRKFSFTYNELGDKPRNFKPKHMESTKLNWTALIIGSILGFLAVFTEDSTLVAALEMSPKTIGWIKIVAYVVSPLLIMYNGAQVFIKNNRNHG